jgi:hypothetical protein
MLLVLAMALSACAIPDPFVATSGSSAVLSGPTVVATMATANGHPGWKSFTDPILGFSFSYPPSWLLLNPGGGDITLASQDGATLSPIVTTMSQSPAQALAQMTPSPAVMAAQHQTVTTIQVAGQPAVDIVSPYIAPAVQPPNSGRALAASRSIVMAVANNAGTTNVYTFLAYFAVDKTGTMSATSRANVQTVTDIVATFELPPIISPIATHR